MLNNSIKLCNNDLISILNKLLYKIYKKFNITILYDIEKYIKRYIL